MIQFFVVFLRLMRLHIFNPEHDIALAANSERFTPPHAGRQLRSDLGWIPALWAEDGDAVVVDDVQAAQRAIGKLRVHKPDVRFVTLSSANEWRNDVTDVAVWGWDLLVCHELRQAGVRDALLPTKEQLAIWRDKSSRRWSAESLLPHLVAADKRFVGESRWFDASKQSDLIEFLQENAQDSTVCFVLKSPWSSSGRGVRYVSTLTPQQIGWIRNVMTAQGGLIVEPFYRKVVDFAMEFDATPDGIAYRGLSVFKTDKSAYVGNLLATESEKRVLLEKYVPNDLLDLAKDKIIEQLNGSLADYVGPLGVDMMIVVQDDGLRLHPCVELNLRSTMGHVALSISPTDVSPWRTMRIVYTDRYHLQILNTWENVLPMSIVR